MIVRKLTKEEVAIAREGFNEAMGLMGMQVKQAESHWAMSRMWSSNYEWRYSE